MKKNLIIIIAVVISIIAILSVGAFFLFNVSDTYYYTQIDESNMTENEKAGQGGVIDFTGGMKYLYTLTCYDKNGKEKTFTFGANKNLKNEAFLKLTTRPIQGVVAWEEIQYKDLPDSVREKYKSPENQ